jgi:hypothetical protein
MLWDDATLSRHFEIQWNCEIRPATADGGEVWGPVEVERWRIWAVGCNSPRRRQPTDRIVASPVAFRYDSGHLGEFLCRIAAMTWTGLDVDRLRPAQDCVKI